MIFVFATNNVHKLQEVRAIVGNLAQIDSLNDHGIFDEIPETQNTLEGNAIQKTIYINKKYGFDCFADDSGLEVPALNNRPGVYSARYAGEGCTFDDNMNKLLLELNEIEDRRARFRTVIALIYNNQIHTFTGLIEGEITKIRKGNKGFGYDPIFKPLNSEITFAEMSSQEKNMISHRFIAVQKLAEFLKSI